MPRPRSLEGALLVILAAGLFFGGGLGCEPDLEGTQLRVTSFEGLRYAAFQGKKAPGNGWAVLEYPIVPPASIDAMVGIFNPRAFAASEDAEGCVGLRRNTGTPDFRICATYQLSPTNLLVWSTLSGTTANCPGATGARLRLLDDGDDVSAFYTCPGGMETLLDDVPSQWDVGQKWFQVFGGYNLGKGAEVGFARLRYTSDGPFEATPDGDIAFASYEWFRLGIEAFHEFDDGDFGGGITFAGQARNELIFATTQTINLGAFPDTDVEKDLIKADKSYFKTFDKLFPDKFDGYFKSFPKIADIVACAISDEEDFLD
jgi:hypothetical protein